VNPILNEKCGEKMNRNKMTKMIVLRETLGVERCEEPVALGIPFSPGEVASPDHLALVDERDAYLPLQATPLATWPDGSLKWVLLDFFATVSAGGTTLYRISHREVPTVTADNGVLIHPDKDFWTIDTGRCEFLLDARQFRPFTAVRKGACHLLRPGLSTCRLALEDGLAAVPNVEEIRVERSGPVRTTLLVRGRFQSPEKNSLVFFSRLHFYRNRSLVKIEFTLRNPRAARHPDGLWDLGDPGSLLFKELALGLALPFSDRSDVFLSPEAGKSPFVRTGKYGVSIYQESSGGENWRSPNHRNRNGEVPLTLRGYEVKEGVTVLGKGLRALPLTWAGEGESGVSVAMTEFWQQFPKAVAADGQAMEIGLFPGSFPDLFELQGGEQKTHTFHIDFSTSRESLAWVRAPLIPTAAPEVFLKAGVFADLPLSDEQGEKCRAALAGPHSSPIESVLNGREIIDEYGWRNFGEIYADHEAVYHQGQAPFVSHYNNQYDLLFSFYREFMTTGDPGWRRLAFELAGHVIDIDIYHTRQDREEYNNGMFWHTDHYLEAGTATHRSFSVVHRKKKDPRFCGGGPGPEHCYTSGLTVHYWLSGDERAKEVVLGLADWICRTLGRPTTVFGALNQARKAFTVLKRTKGDGQARFFPKYPLSRGTGNAINACLDAFDLTAEDHYLKAAEEFIRGTVHPEDQVDHRTLLDAERAWSYTVFLVSIGRYLDGKVGRQEIDGVFDYARESLLTYARWMADHESPYLDHPEILEYPNETWAAQELRKSVVLYYAARFSEGNWRSRFLEKSAFFWEAGWRELSARETRSLARPVALVLQNTWVESRLAKGLPAVCPAAKTTEPVGKPTPLLSLRTVFTRAAKELMGAVQTTSLRRELSWLKARVR